MKDLEIAYCGYCDHNYIRGTYSQHCKSFAHLAERKHRAAMQIWYRNNAKLYSVENVGLFG